MLDHVTASWLLHSATTPSQEQQRPWNFPPFRYHHNGVEILNNQSEWRDMRRTLWDLPLMRLWDRYSGSQPGEAGSLAARNSRQRVDTWKSRRDSLKQHSNYGGWDRPTPFISFVSIPGEVEGIAETRAKSGRMGNTLTVMSPYVRFAKGLPILNAFDEMWYYDVDDPYDFEFEFYRDEHLCLWEVTSEEVVGPWNWQELSRNPNWYREVVMPAYERHRDAYRTSHLGHRPAAPVVRVNALCLTGVAS